MRDVSLGVAQGAACYTQVKTRAFNITCTLDITQLHQLLINDMTIKSTSKVETITYLEILDNPTQYEPE